jgi:DNA-directed RNA polymerase subunit F
MRSKRSFYEWIKEADQFGEQIIFTINSKSSYKSYTGLLFTALLLCVGVAMLIFMGQSFFFKTNPLTTGSMTKLYNSPFYNTSDSSKMFVAFKFTDQAFLEYPADGAIISYSYQKNSPKQVPLIELRAVPLCREAAGLDQDYVALNGLNGNNIYCLMLNSEYFGGDSTDNTYTNFQLTINLCPSYLSICDRSKVNLINTATLTYYVHFYYPEVFFDPNDPDEPLTVKHSKILDVYTGNSYIYREVYFQSTTLLDDSGWIFEDNRNTTEITVGDTFSRVIYKSSDTADTIGKYYFYVGPNKIMFTRKYQKFQDVIAIVGGFIKICQTVLQFFLSSFIKYLRNIDLMNGIINWKDDEEVQLPKNMNDRLSLDTKVKKALRLVSGSIAQSKPLVINDESFQQFDKNSKDLKDVTNIAYNASNHTYIPKHESNILDVSEQTILKLRENKANKINLTEKVSYKRSQYEKDELDIYKLKNEIFTKKKKKRKYSFYLTGSEICKKIFCRRLLSENQKVKVCIYDYAERYLKERLDVFGYLDLVNEVNKIKSIFFNSSQIAALNNIENPTIPVNQTSMTPENVDNLKYLFPSRSNVSTEDEIKKISDYFSKKIIEQSLSYADKVLLMSLQEDILKELLHKLLGLKEKMRMKKLVKFDEDNQDNEEVLNF